MDLYQFHAIASKLEEIPLPGLEAQLKMAPTFRTAFAEHFTPPPKDSKIAAVLLLLFPTATGDINFVLIRRPAYNGTHAKQISFPGGKAEPQDRSLWETALRETQEEVGVERNDVQLIRALTPTYIPPSNFLVHPYVGICTQTPKFIAEEKEVEEILYISLVDLMNDAHETFGWVSPSYAGKVEVPVYNFDTLEVWGATAMMLSEFKHLMRLAK